MSFIKTTLAFGILMGAMIMLTPAAQALDFGEFSSFSIPGLAGKKIDDFAKGATPVSRLINVILPFTAGFIVMVGVVTIVVAGFLYMTAGGNGQQVNLAKTLIMSALGGIVLALTAIIILNTIGPQFTEEPTLPPDSIKK